MSRVRAALLVVVVALSSCGDKPGAPPPPPPKEVVDLSLPVPAGQSRAGRAAKVEDLVGGPNAKGRIGDFKLANSKVRFIIEDAVPSSGYGPYGGGVLAADRVRAKGEPDQSYFGELIPAFDLRAVRPTKAEVIRDGTEGGTAQVRVTAVDDTFPLLEAFLSDGKTAGAKDIKADIVIDYVLEPEAEALKVVTTIKSRTGEGLEIAAAQLGMLMGDGVLGCQDGVGFGSHVGPLPYYAAAAEDAAPVSYAVFAPGYPLESALSLKGMTLVTLGKVVVPGTSEGKVTFHLAVGDGDTASLLRIGEGLKKQKLPRLKVRAVAGGKPVPGARVHLTQPDGYRALAIAKEDGAVEVPLPPGTYTAEAVSDGRDSAGPVSATVTEAGGSVEVSLTEQGVLSVSVTEAGAPLPAKVVLFRESPPPAKYPPSYGVRRAPADATLVVFLPPEGRDIPLVAGKHRVVAQRGFEYDLSEQVAEVPANGKAKLAFRLTRVVDTAGYLSGDFHIHAAPSADSDDAFSLKALSFGAEGLEVPVSTEHEIIADYTPTVAALGLSRFVRPIVGEEVSTVPFGHFNAFPLLLLDRPNNGAVDWYNKPAKVIFEEMRKNPGEPLIQVNHPRSGIGMGYFSMVGFNRDTFTAEKPAEFHPTFDAIEVLNGMGIGSSEGEVQKDWFAFLKRGYRITGTGNSDSHDSLRSEVGTPRNYVRVGSDEPSTMDSRAFVKAVRGGAVTVSSGPFVTLTVNGRDLGALAPMADGKAKLHVKVQAPAWMGPIETLEILKDGVVVESRALTVADKTLRYEGDFEDAPAKDAFYLVRVRSQGGNLGPAAPGKRPYAFTNPVFVDADGNGKFQP